MKLIFKLFCFLFMVQLMANGQIIYLKGNATINENKAQKSATVNLGDTLRTNEQSILIVKLDTGTTLKINENSELKVTELNLKANKTLIHLIKGSSFFKKDPNQLGKLNITTNVASLGVRGTEFFVSYGLEKADHVFMCVKTGSVYVSSKSEQEKDGKIVNAGEGVQVSSLSKISDPRFLPWTKNLNWNLDPKSKSLENKVKIDESYGDPLRQDYD